MLSGCLPLILALVVGLAWGTVAQRRVKSLGIIAELDVSGHILAGVFPRRVGGAVDPLDFERGIERFREGIIEAGTHSAHRLADVEPGDGFGERLAEVLPGLNWWLQHRLGGATVAARQGLRLASSRRGLFGVCC